MKEIDDIFNDWDEEEWGGNNYSLNELKSELKDCVHNNDFNTYGQTVDELKGVCESYMRYNVITDYDVRWDMNNLIDVYLNPINGETIVLNITIVN